MRRHLLGTQGRYQQGCRVLLWLLRISLMEKRKWAIISMSRTPATKPGLLYHLNRREAASNGLLLAGCLFLVQDMLWAQFAQNLWIPHKEHIAKKSQGGWLEGALFTNPRITK